MHKTNLEDVMPNYEFKANFMREMQVRTLMALESIADSLKDKESVETVINTGPGFVPCADCPDGAEPAASPTPAAPAPWTINEGPVGSTPLFTVNPFSTTPIPVPPTGPSASDAISGVTPEEVQAVAAPFVDDEIGDLYSWYCGTIGCPRHWQNEPCCDPECELCDHDWTPPSDDELWPIPEEGTTSADYTQAWVEALLNMNTSTGGDRVYIPWDDIRPKGDPIGTPETSAKNRWTFGIEADSKSDDDGYLVKMHDSKTNKDRIIFRGTDRECIELWYQVRL